MSTLTAPSKPTESLAGCDCPACGMGKLALLQIDYVYDDGVAPAKTVKGVWAETCPHCNERYFPPGTSKFIEAVLDELVSTKETPAMKFHHF